LIHGVTVEGVALIWTAAIRPRVGGVAAFAMALPVAFSATWLTATMLFYWVERPLSLCRRAPRPAPEAVAAHSVHG
jgi:hypothetical protein